MNTTALSLETNPLLASQLPAQCCTNHYDKSDIIQKLFDVLPPHSWHSQYVRNGHRWCANKEAWNRLAEAIPQWTMDLIANAYTCTQIKEKQNKTLIKKHGTRMKNTQRETRIHFYRISCF